MDRFINAFSRSQNRKDDEGRSHQFAKRLTTSTTSPSIVDKVPGPTLSASDLSPTESDVYVDWWNALDPFGLGIAHEKDINRFLMACGLDQDLLQQITTLYDGEPKYMEEQFYAIIRLASHGQCGRKINRDLVALGAPLAQLNKNALDDIFRQESFPIQPISTVSSTKTAKDQSRNTWWGQSSLHAKDTQDFISPLPQQQQHQGQQQPLLFPNAISHRHSYASSTYSTPAFVSPAIQSQQPAVSSIYQPTPSWSSSNNDKNNLISPDTPLIPVSSALNQVESFAWAEQALSTIPDSYPQLPNQHPLFKSNPANTSTTSKNIYSHSRSRSVPYASQDMPSSTDFVFDTITATQTKQDHSRPVLTSSRSSMDTTTLQRLIQEEQPMMDQGQSLLLTQKFVPPASKVKSTNPFEDSNDDDDDDDNSDDENDNNNDRNNCGNRNNNNRNDEIRYDNTTNIKLVQPLEQQQSQQITTKSPFDDNEDDDSNVFISNIVTLNTTTYPNTDTDEDINPSQQPPMMTTGTTVTPTLSALGNLAFSSHSINQQANKSNVPAPPVPPQRTKPSFPRYARNQPVLKRSQSQHSGKVDQKRQQQQQQQFMTQGAFLFATSSTSSSVPFPTSSSLATSTSSTDSPLDNTTRLFRHRSATSFLRQ